MPDGDSPSLRPAAASPGVVGCPVCGQDLPADGKDDHLRTAHRLFRYRDVFRDLDATLDAITVDLLTAPPDPAAWGALKRLATDERGADADRYVAAKLAVRLERLPPPSLDLVIPAVAALLAGEGADVLLTLAVSRVAAARRLALAGLVRLPRPHDRPVRRAVRRLVRDRQVPLDDRLDAMTLALPPLGESPQGRKLLKAFFGRHGKTKRLDRVRRLLQRTGPLPLLDRTRVQLEGRLRMGCPRCDVQLRPAAMAAHLWEQHRLVLDGTRVRDPWTVLAEWLDGARTGDRAAWVDRCGVAADKIDPQQGTRRLVRLLLQRGLADEEVKEGVLAEARERHATCCPWCYALVPLPREEPGAVLVHRGRRLAGGGTSVTVDDTGLRPWLEIITPRGILYRDREPDGGWTPRGAAFLWAATLIALALGCALFWPLTLGLPLRPVVVLLFAAWLIHYLFRTTGKNVEAVGERVLDHTWRWLVPRLHADGFDLADSAFVTGLARLYSKEGRTDPPEDDLARLVRIAETAVEAGKAPAAHLAALVRLQIEAAWADEEDPVPLVVRWLDRCLTGKLPLAFAQELLEEWATDWWTPRQLARLRVLTCDRAFEAGFEVENLLDLGQTAPALGDILRVESPRRLAALRLVWSLRASRPWGRMGDVYTAFDLAVTADRAGPLADQPDLLLWQQDRRFPLTPVGDRSRAGPATVAVTVAGVWVQDLLFIIPPRRVEVRKKVFGYELTLGRDAFRCAAEVDGLARLLERWFRWTFHEFLPRVDEAVGWQSPGPDGDPAAWGAVPCPECGQFLLPRLGGVGLAAGEAVVVDESA
ncbi:MAG: hypothetical protein U0736_12220 [Gemmataceae bacterium]